MSTTGAVVMYSGELDVCYAQFYVVTAAADKWVDMNAAFAGQANGLCGGGQPGRLFFVDWEGLSSHVLQLSPRAYRVRYSARGMLADWEDELIPHELQTYRIQFWPEPSRPDETLSVSGDCAKYWHAEVSKSSGADDA